jgi:hypothetical protein
MFKFSGFGCRTGAGTTEPRDGTFFGDLDRAAVFGAGRDFARAALAGRTALADLVFRVLADMNEREVKD